MRFIGRNRERAALLEGLGDGGPLVSFVHGPAGTGKSALLETFADAARDAGATVVGIDCRSFEPTAAGMLDAIGRSLAVPCATVEDAALAVKRAGTTVVLMIDTFELFRISEPWLPAALLPALDASVRVVVAGREPPVTAWFSARSGGFRSLRLEPLAETDALSLLMEEGMTESDARAVNRVARGHPLALQVAAVALRERPGVRVQDATIPRVVAELTGLYVDHLDPPTRELLDAASVVRRMHGGLLAAMLPEAPVRESLDRLAALPFVDEATDGLRLHDAVQEAIAARLRARDPEAHRRLRAAAWKALHREADEATRSELWRFTADMLYLLENPAVREAFFPTTAHLYAVEPARASDGDAIERIVARHETPETAAALATWWTHLPSAFRVVRDRAGTVAGLIVVAEAGSVPQAIIRADPVVAAWHDHQERHPLPRGQRALLDRAELSAEFGSGPSPVQAATWLDIKRIYMEMRPHLGRLYTVMSDITPFAEALATLGFAVHPATVTLGREYTLASLDFGPESVDGWLARLAANELGIHADDMLDPENRELVLGGRRTQLTPLEFGVLAHLLERKGTALSRATLIEKVWGYRDSEGSNVVDVVVRSLRKKLGDKAASLETIRGVGYRFR